MHRFWTVFIQQHTSVGTGQPVKGATEYWSILTKNEKKKKNA